MRQQRARLSARTPAQRPGPRQLQLDFRPSSEQRAAFAADLAALTNEHEKIGLAVSGGPDSLALLLLANAVAPKRILAATVDHRLRDEAADEARMVGDLCAKIGIEHEILTATWNEGVPTSNIQAAARKKRYALLKDWAGGNGVTAIATGHHADDQAETVLMRLARGAGVSGLAGIRAVLELGDEVRLIRPLLGWARSELQTLVQSAGIEPVDDPTNRDPAHDRTRMRACLGEANFGDAGAYAQSARNIAQADEALEWTAARLADIRLRVEGNGFALTVGTMPDELLRRVLLIAFARLGDTVPRGPELERAMTALKEERKATLGGLMLTPDGTSWKIEPEPSRNT